MPSTDPNNPITRKIYEFIVQHPGCRQSQIARGVGLLPKNVPGHVTAMEAQGYMLSEDDRGRLYAEGTRDQVRRILCRI